MSLKSTIYATAFAWLCFSAVTHQLTQQLVTDPLAIQTFVPQYKPTTFSPSVTAIVYTEQYVVFPGYAGSIDQYDRATGEWIRNMSYPTSFPVLALQLYTDPNTGHEYVIAGGDTTTTAVPMFDLETGLLVHDLPIPSNLYGIWTMGFAPDNSLWIPTDPTTFRIFPDVMDPLTYRDLAFENPNGQSTLSFHFFKDWVVVADWTTQVQIFDARNGSLLLNFYQDPATFVLLTKAYIDENFAMIYVARDNTYVDRWLLTFEAINDAQTEFQPVIELRNTIENADTNLIWTMDIIDTSYLLVAGSGRRLHVYDLISGWPIRKYVQGQFEIRWIVATTVSSVMVGWDATPAGYVSETSLGVCDAGYEAVASPMCVPCPDGKLKPSSGPFICDSCPVNAICSDTNWECEAGYYLPGAGQNCTRCPLGTYKPATGDAQSLCLSCPQNSVCGLTSYTCATGYQLDNSTGLCCPMNSKCNSTSFTCQVGYIKNDNQTACVERQSDKAEKGMAGTTAGIVVAVVAAVAIAGSVWWWKVKMPQMADAALSGNQSTANAVPSTAITITPAQQIIVQSTDQSGSNQI